MSAPIETKVTAATVGAVLSSLGVWALQTFVFHGDLPLPVSVAVQTLVPGAVAFVSGYLARHTPRPDLAAGPRRHALDGEPSDIPVSEFRRPPDTP
jgi:hypothetical protein